MPTILFTFIKVYRNRNCALLYLNIFRCTKEGRGLKSLNFPVNRFLHAKTFWTYFFLATYVPKYRNGYHHMQDCLETLQTVRKDSQEPTRLSVNFPRLSQNFPDCPETCQIVQKIVRSTHPPFQNCFYVEHFQKINILNLFSHPPTINYIYIEFCSPPIEDFQQ